MSADLARDVGVGIKLNIKADRPTALFPKWVVQSQRARRAIIGRTRPLLAIKAKSASPTMTAVTSSDRKSANTLKKLNLAKRNLAQRD